MKRIFAFFLALMLFTCTAAAQDAEVFTSGDFEYTVLDDGTVSLKKYTGKASELTIPAELDGKPVTAIGEEAISTKLTAVTIPDSVTTIERVAFAQCKKLKKIVIPDSVTYIGIGAFVACESLESVTLPDGITTIEEGTFEACWSLRSVTIPDSVTTIGDRAFSGCGLKEITIPDSVTSIADDAFEGCDAVIHRGSSAPSGQSAQGWICESCGKTGLDGNFCANCGAAKPAGTADTSLPLAIPDPAEVFGVDRLGTEEDEGIKYYFYALPDENVLIYAQYGLELLLQEIDFSEEEEHGWLRIDADGATAVFAVLDDRIALAFSGGNAQGGGQSTQETDVEVAAELLCTFKMPFPEGFDWESIAGWDEEDRAMMSTRIIFLLIYQDEYTGEYEFENMYSGSIRYKSGYEEFMLVAADGDDVLFLTCSADSSEEGTVYCHRLIDADPSNMPKVIERIRQTPPGEGAVLSLMENDEELMVKYLNMLTGEQDVQPDPTSPTSQSVDSDSALLPDLGIFLQCGRYEDIPSHPQGGKLVSYSFDMDEGKSVIKYVLELMLEPEYQLKLDRYEQEDYISTSAMLFDWYYYSYTGNASVGQVENLSTKTMCQVYLSVAHFYAEDRILITLHFGSGFTLVDPGKKLKNPPTDFSGNSGGTNDFGNSDCWICGGDGKCDDCGGTGEERVWAGDRYMTVTCNGAFCWSGKCSACGGKGHK